MNQETVVCFCVHLLTLRSINFTSVTYQCLCLLSQNFLCSRRRFGEHQAESWWNENRDKVYEKYNVRSSERVSSASSIRSARLTPPSYSLPGSGHQKTWSGSAEAKVSVARRWGILFAHVMSIILVTVVVKLSQSSIQGLVRLPCSDVMYIELWNTETWSRGWAGRGWDSSVLTVEGPAQPFSTLWKPWLL